MGLRHSVLDLLYRMTVELTRVFLFVLGVGAYGLACVQGGEATLVGM